MDVKEAIAAANALLPGQPAQGDENDLRWQAILEVGDFVESDPEEVWSFVEQWGCHEQPDLRMAISTCLQEHLLEHHFDLIFPRVAALARNNLCFKDTFLSCWKFGQSESVKNSARFDRLRSELACG